MHSKAEQFQITPAYLLRLVLVNTGAALAAAVVMAWVGRQLQPRQMVLTFLMALVYSFSIGIPAGLLLPLVAHYFQSRGIQWKLAAIGAVILLLTAAGCLIAGVVLVWVGLDDRRMLWAHYWDSLRLGSLMALTVSSVVFAYEDLRGRLHEATLELRTRQLKEERADKLIAEARLSSLESRIHPHFLFNTLNSIASLVQEDPARAEEIIGRLAALLRFSLDSTRHSTVPLAQEIKIVRDYLEIEKARFGDRLRYVIELPPELESAQIPPLAVQTLVENSVKHAIAPRREGGEIVVRASASAEGVEVAVADTGPGFRMEQAPVGHGIDNLAGRLNFLFGEAARLESIAAGGLQAARIVLPR